MNTASLNHQYNCHKGLTLFTARSKNFLCVKKKHKLKKQELYQNTLFEQKNQLYDNSVVVKGLSVLSYKLPKTIYTIPSIIIYPNTINTIKD